jgi:glycosyltransferase involved in cell wall biosynthesis
MKKPKLLHIFSVEGNLGDAIRINEMSKYLRKHSNYQSLNLAYEIGSKINTRTISTIIRGISRRDSWKTIKERLYLERCVLTIKNKLKEGFDVIVAEMAQNGYAAIKALERTKTKVITDIHGMASKEYEENKYLKTDSSYLRLFSEIERVVFKKSNMLICVSSCMKEYIRKKHGIAANILLGPNGTQCSSFKADFSKPLNIIYGGIMAFWEDLDTYLDLAKIDSQNRYFLMGDGPEKERLLSRIKKEQIKIKYLGSKKRTEAHRFFSKMSVGIAPTSTGITRRVASPIKVYDYMSLGLPVITARCGDWGEDIANFDAGFVCRKSDPKEFYRAVKLLEDRQTWQIKSNNALTLARNKNWQHIFEQGLGELFT